MITKQVIDRRSSVRAGSLCTIEFMASVGSAWRWHGSDGLNGTRRPSARTATHLTRE